jgi:hypothetical protein
MLYTKLTWRTVANDWTKQLPDVQRSRCDREGYEQQLELIGGRSGKYRGGALKLSRGDRDCRKRLAWLDRLQNGGGKACEDG